MQLDLIAATAFGLESVVVRELANLGYPAKPISTGRVLFQADFTAIARANTWLRAADRILLRLAHFPATDFDQLFEGVKNIPWHEWIPADAAFPVAGRSVKSQLSSVPALQRTVKKAIAEKLLAAHRVTTLDEIGSTYSVEVSLLDDTAVLTLDTTGVGLHKRGYRDLVGEAALKETLAAGLVLLSVWNPDRPLIDPFCGSGTIAIEAAMIGRNLAPGRLRTFDAVDWPVIPDSAWDTADQEAADLAKPSLPITIFASDISEEALVLGRRHAKTADVDRSIHFARRDFADLSSKADYGCIIANPPYGQRLGTEEQTAKLYRLFPEVLRRFPTWSHHILTAWPYFENTVGQPATRRRKLFNAQIECTYYQFLGPRPPQAKDWNAEDTDERINEIAESKESSGEVAEVAATSESAPSPAPAAITPAFGGLRDRDERELGDFARCLANNARHLRKFPKQGITCYRLYERDCPDVPAIVDRYEDHAHIIELEREHSRTLAQHADWLDRVAAITAETLEIPPARVHFKNRPKQRGLSQHERTADTGNRMTVHEGDLKFEVNLDDYADTGLFLDHRITRQLFREQASGKRILNLFCYTGSFTVYAAAGGATSSVSVDLSNTYLEWAQRNLGLNTLYRPEHRLVRSDVLEFLRSHPPGEHYDLAIIDPPTFSNSKRTDDVWEVQDDHVEVLTLVRALLSPQATIFFSNNFRRFKLAEDQLAPLYQIQDITKRTIPPDFRNDRIHKCWRMKSLSSASAGE